MAKQIAQLDTEAIKSVAEEVTRRMIAKHGIGRVEAFKEKNNSLIMDFVRFTWICIREKLEAA